MLRPLNLDQDAPWRKRFRAPIILWSQIASQNPDRGIVVSNRDGIYQLYAWDVPSGTLQRLTDAPAGVTQGVISADGSMIYYLYDSQGDEIGHYFSVPFEGGKGRDLTPDLPAYASNYFTESYDGCYYGFSAANQYGFQAYVVDKQGGTPHLRYESQMLSVGPLLSFGGEISVIASTEKSNTTDFSLEAYDTRSGEKLGELWDGPGTSIMPVGFATREGDMRFLATTNRSGFARPLIWNTRTQDRIDIEDAAFQGEISAWDWSRDGRYLLLHQLYQAEDTLFLYDLREKQLTRLMAPIGTYSPASPGYFSPQGSIYVHWQDASHPSCLLELDGQTGAAQRTVLAAGEAPPGQPWRSISFASSDGVMIQAWLATPPGDGPFPTIIHTHGGPTAVQTPVFHPVSQSWLDHGFAFCSINYRGSTTFGKDFEKAIDGRLGALEIEDIEAGVNYLIAQGIAAPDSILKTGGSYGGYLTLYSLARKPDLWAGGMALVAIADWSIMYEDEAETLRAYQRALFGGGPEERAEAYAQSSPLTFADQIRADLLVIQGRNDTRCPARQMEIFERKLKARNQPIHVEWFDAGHGSRAMEESIRQQELMLRFAYRVLG